MPRILHLKPSRCAASFSSTRSIAPGALASGRHSALRIRLIAFCSGCLLTGFVARAENGRSAAELEALLRQVEQQITVGHVIAPAGDNAVDTWLQVPSAVSSPSGVNALTDFVTYMRQHAADEQAAGRPAVAANLLVFVDEATQMLQRENSPPTAPASPGLTGDLPLSTLSTGMASRDMKPSDAPNGPVQSAAPEPWQSLVNAVPVQRSPSGSAASNAPQLPDAVGKEAMISASAANKPDVPPVFLAPEQPAAASFIRRGDAMLAIKDISAARKFYEYAANAGSARAATTLAETYDPDFINQLGAVGLRPDPALAANWYQKAAALGSQTAEVRLRTLRVEAVK
jgi:hypothetical protein